MAQPALPPKTPISFLQELCARRGITPKYDLMSIEGAVHEPTFVYRVTVGEINATGTGQSKKKAKHAAAKAILEALLSGQNAANIALPTEKQEQVNSITPILSPYDDGIPGNPVGALQELCMSRRWPPPNYEVVEEEGLPHERMFTMGCSVKKYAEKGTGKSKKLAKRQAAYKMLEKLKDVLPTKPENASNMDDDDDEHMQSTYRDCKIPSLTPLFSQKISQFYKNMKATPGITLSRLHTNYMNLNPVQFLHEIANEHNFDVTYVDVEERSKSGNEILIIDSNNLTVQYVGQFQCLVQLSTLPVAVCHGTGDTTESAQTNAAENALDYLRIMTRE